MGRYPRSDGLHRRALAISPLGAQTLSKARARFGGDYPAFISEGYGGRVRDVDGNEYVDLIASLGAVVLGHNHRAVRDAMADAVADIGGTFSLPHPLEMEVGERLCEMTGWDQVRWCVTGSEASEAAIRTARIATGREIVLQCGYHSWNSTFAASRPTCPGVPASFKTVIGEFPYNDTAAFLAWTRVFGEKIAAVIIEPVLLDLPAEGFLETICEETRRIGALLISDEIVCGFRWHVQGAMRGIYGHFPDMAIFGKAISNGAFPVSALLLPNRLAEHAWAASGTYNGHPIGLAAVGAVLETFGTDYPLLRLRQFGSSLLNMLEAALQAFPRPIFAVVGNPQRIALRPRGLASQEEDRVAMTLLLQSLAERGVLWHPVGVNPMAVHNRADLAQVAGAMIESLGLVHNAHERGIMRNLIRGSVLDPGIAIRADAGHISSQGKG